VILETEN